MNAYFFFVHKNNDSFVEFYVDNAVALNIDALSFLLNHRMVRSQIQPMKPRTM